MKFRTLISIAALSLLPLAANAATLVVPAAGTGPGASSSQWQSELTIHNAAPRAATISVAFHVGTTVLGPVDVQLGARQTLSIADVARTKFGVQQGTGALVIEAADRDARSIAVTSRTFNTSAEGEFGQDVPSVNVTDAARAGDVAALPGPSAATNNRFNFGVYAVDATVVTWELVRADGTVAATKSVNYAAGQHAQYGAGIETLLGATTANNDTVLARIVSGKALFYGSIINATGDPTFVPGVRAREDVVITFAGVDLDEDGSIDIRDADQDGVLDSPVAITTSLFAAHFRVVASGEFGETLQYAIVSSPATKTDVVDANGTLRVVAAGDLKNTSGEVQVRITTGTTSSVVTIPVVFE
jgi:hypothetical protein